MIRNDIYTVFYGKEYRVIRLANDHFELLSENSEDLANGFIEDRGYENLYIRHVTKADNLDIYAINTFGVYKGREFPIEGENETHYFLRYNNAWEPWLEKAGFVWHDRDNITGDIPKTEVDPVYERKTPLPDFFD